VNSALPAISGLAEDMQTLTVSPGTWTGAQPIAHAYQWLRCSTRLRGCAPIQGATATEYRAVGADVGARLVVTVRASNAGGASTVTTPRTDRIAPAKPRPGNTVLPVSAVVAPNRLRIDSVRFSPTTLRPGRLVRLVVVVEDRRGFLVEGASVSATAPRGVLRGAAALTDSRGRAVLVRRVGRVTGRAIVVTVAAEKQGEPSVRAVTAVRLAVLR
jgi:hypothetical protein